MMDTKRKTNSWIDSVKVLACILVVLGHLFQSLATSGIIQRNGCYLWFNSTVYYFHVPLFFICSGYLHQMKREPLCFGNWSKIVLKKLVTLGIPYFVFSAVTWLLKSVFSGSVNHQSTGLFEILFLDPESPYWYLYALFFIFVITLPFFSRNQAILGLAAAVVMKIVSVLTEDEIGIFLLSTVLTNELWFVLGMIINISGFPDGFTSAVWRKRAGILGVCFLVLSAMIAHFRLENGFVSTLMGLIGCAATILLIINIRPSENRVIEKVASFTMPVFLMHTIFAAGLRIVLMKLGVFHPLMHILLGIFISFAGPVVGAKIMKNVKLDILLYPGKGIRFD